MENEEEDPGNKKTVLVVEDEEFTLKAYKVKLEKAGFEVLIAKDGSEAVNYLKKDPPDIVLLDLMLPYLNGFEVLEKLRTTPKWQKVPVLITTNLGQPEDKDRALKLGATDYLIKTNVKIDEIVKKIKDNV
ncbi:MAG: hypothetical protein A3J48_00995 [Candidatus Doudnabacteria bacterium RIFCSPHIGHO2_02_FULL_46_11]|uniref:Response regulatory domain-containing protein n=1 Tax=Candidatus Doudnabacteria bacterium RIFCSPHIGHO2_02_FULL_46_11 TaxID=1817832 RepID=A0A1F5P7J9_9BACT|nr:MAG: hypothetical protein A3J48_00995 [Candidatus Doudnabacteria bacterium RIFCSPHIGHO2_02_FULL_46_11]